MKSPECRHCKADMKLICITLRDEVYWCPECGVVSRFFKTTKAKQLWHKPGYLFELEGDRNVPDINEARV